MKSLAKTITALLLCPILTFSAPGSHVLADDELARYAAEGNKVGVDGQCFMRQCAVETTQCASDQNCIKGLSCLARCKGGSLCSTGCFAKYGSDKLDSLLHCSVEKHDCVHVPGKDSVAGWSTDTLADLPAKPANSFKMSSLDGTWYKVMGLDTRYDCFDCQMNSFKVKNSDTLSMEAMFRIPRPTNPGYLQNNIAEELHTVASKRQAASKDSLTGAILPSAQAAGPLNAPVVQPHLQSSGQMFGLTFWENWYIMGESKPNPMSSIVPLAKASGSDSPDLKLIYYTGHTLQGSYKGAFLYSRSRELTPGLMKNAKEVITSAGLDPNDFCKIRNQCFLQDNNNKDSYTSMPLASADQTDEDIEEKNNSPFWFLGGNFFRASKAVANELSDWFEDPTIASDWLLSQQEKMVLSQPLEVSPFASLEK